MNSTAKRALGILLAIVLIAGVVVAIFIGRIGHPSGSGTTSNSDKNLTLVNGVIGSESQAFFTDPTVQKVFRDHGLNVQVTTAGSRQIATTVNLAHEDFVFPSSAPSAVEVEGKTSASTVYAPFYSPMAIATFKPIVAILKSAGIAYQDSGGIWHLNMAAYLKAVAAGTRWNQLPGASSAYPSQNSLLISSTDIRQSNSAAMYLSMASYVDNGNNIVSSPTDQANVITAMGNLFLEQGFSASSSAEPFDDYLSQGIGSKPMVMIYESQFLGEEMDKADAGAITKDMVLMYPDPDVFSKHTLVPLDAKGTRVGELLDNDPTLAKLAALYGFRPASAAVFNSVLRVHHLAIPPLPVNVVEPPTYEILESMIEAISARYTAPVPSATPTN